MYSFFFLMIRRPPRSTPLSLHDALPILRRPCLDLPCQDALKWTIYAPSSQSEIKPTGSIAPGNLKLSKRRSEEHTSELQSRQYLVCRLLLEKKKKKQYYYNIYNIIMER